MYFTFLYFVLWKSQYWAQKKVWKVFVLEDNVMMEEDGDVGSGSFAMLSLLLKNSYKRIIN